MSDIRVLLLAHVSEEEGGQLPQLVPAGSGQAVEVEMEKRETCLVPANLCSFWCGGLKSIFEGGEVV